MRNERKRLIVLPPSHYCERARWALDHKRVAYTEVPWAVGCHLPLARWLAPATTLPILVTGEGVIQGSDRILDWADVSGGDAQVEDRFENGMGPLVRQYIYAAILGDAESRVREVLFDGVSAVQARIGRLMWPVTRRFMISAMKARPELVGELEKRLAAELDWFDRCIRGRRHLVRDKLGRADITAASLLAPLARPPACPLYRQIVLPPRVEETLRRWSARPALEWVQRLYADYRH